MCRDYKLSLVLIFFCKNVTGTKTSKNIDCLTVRTACLVCFISTVNGRSNKKKEEAYPWKAGTSSGHITNLKQSILETFDIYEWALGINKLPFSGTR